MPAEGGAAEYLVEQAAAAAALAAGRPPGAMSHIGKIANRGFLVLPIRTTPPGCAPRRPQPRGGLCPSGRADAKDGAEEVGVVEPVAPGDLVHARALASSCGVTRPQSTKDAVVIR